MAAITDFFKNNKKKEELRTLREELEDFRFYFEEFSTSLPLPVLSVNPLGFILDTNHAFEVLTGLNKEEILGQLAVNFFPEKEKIENLQGKVLAGKKILGQETIVAPSGSKKNIPVSVFMARRKDRAGNVLGCFICIYDISEFKTLQEGLEEKVRERTKELQERLSELERFHRLTVGRELKMIELKKELRGEQNKTVRKK
ncbi:MAG: PAS domain-containing protein [Candidatus Pacebacteria bacterium]|nr:PAS domain-containing protein [Candidatus Paceibacterota bacterium]